MREPDPRAIERLAPYRLPREQVRVTMREHWASKVEPIATVLVTFVMVLVIGALMPASMGLLSDAAWWLWFALLLRLGWSLLNWHLSWFIATDRRLLLLYGVITKRVAMMPLAKVTDMSYTRSIMGRLLGYGTFTLESAGQDQALQRITFVRDPDETYRAICSEIFGSFDPVEDGPSAVDGRPDGGPDGWDDGGWGGPDGGGPDGWDDDGRWDPSGAPSPEDTWGETAPPVRDDAPGHRPPPRAPRHDDDTVELDPTDLPVRPMGSYLVSGDRQVLGRRWLRRPIARQWRADDAVLPPEDETIRDDADADGPGWEVSREHVTGHQPTRSHPWV